MLKFFFLILSLSFFTLGLYSHEEKSILIYDRLESEVIGKKVYIFEDKEKKFGIDSISKLDHDNLFKISDEDYINLGISQSRFWIKFTVKNQSLIFQKYILDYSFSYEDSIKFYIPRDNGIFEEIHSGNEVPISKRIYQSRNFLFPIELSAFEEKTYYLRVESEDAIFVPLTIRSLENHDEVSRLDQFFQGLYFGAIFVMLLYNSFIYFSTRDKAYIFYLLYLIVSSLLFQASLKGILNEYFFPESPEFAINVQLYLFSANSIIIPLLTIHLINSKQYPFLHKILSYNALVCMIFFLFIPISSFYTMNSILNLVTVITISVNFIAISYAVYKGYRPAIYYFISFSLVIVSGLALLLSYMNVIPLTPLVWSLYQIAQALEAGLMGFSLGDRFNSIKREQDLIKSNSLLNQKIALDNLEKFEKMKSNFLTSISKELMTPLNTIIGVTESLKSSQTSKFNTETIRNLDMVLDSGRTLSTMLSEILDFSNILSNEIILDQIRLNLREECESVLRMYIPVFKRKGIRYENFVGVNFSINADQNRLKQILHIIISNAGKFTDEGVVRVLARVYDKNPDFVQITIEDTGKGMTDEELESLMLSLGSTIETNYPTDIQKQNLGLNLSRKLIELHGGKLWADSKKGVGSAFHCTLPLYKQDLTEVTEKEMHTDPQLKILETKAKKEITILVVDDEPINVYVLNSLLKTESYNVIEAGLGKQAIEICFSDNRPDIVLLDVMMPDISGMDVCKTLRSKFSLYELPIIIITSKSKSEAIQESFEAGANDFIYKPIEKIELMSRIKTLLELKKSILENQRNLTLNHELGIAQKLQTSLLPLKSPEIPAILIEARYIPMTFLGGDFYDYHVSRENQLGVLIADVTGHGIAAAMVASMLKTAFQTQRPYYSNPSKVMQEMNNILAGSNDQLLTASYAYFDISSGLLYIASAGHPPIFQVKPDGTIRAIKPSGKILGFKQNLPYETGIITFEKGDRFVFYTDGLTDCTDVFGETFGEDRFKELLVSNIALNTEDFADSIIKYTQMWSGKQVPEDDITLIVLDIIV
ncbi:MAG: SpoIIE family protein phosphatase [Leptospiraceae bacterium]|nr:SpoIIE family protein phosphatase [Leptospiraceae bacterium]